MLRGTGYRTTLGGAARLVGGCVLAACSAGDTPSNSGADVTIEPNVVTVVAGTSQPFVAAVSGKSNPAISWSVEEGAAAGGISPTGIYLASNRSGTYHVVAADRDHPASRGRATVTVVPRQEIAVAIASPLSPAVTLTPGGSVAFLARVNGAGNRNVVWTIETGQPVPGGSINVDGVYTAPPLATILPYLEQFGSISAVVRARSVVDPSESGTRPVVIQQQPSPLTLSPPSVIVGLGGSVPLVLSETLFTPTTWTVNSVIGGDATVGRIVPSGGYRAPFQAPDPATVTVGNSAATNVVAVTLVSRFLPPETIPVQACPACRAAQPIALAAADFNSDGLADLATANAGSGTLSVLMAADSVHFAAPYRLPFGSPGASAPSSLLAIPLSGGQPPALVATDAARPGSAVRARRGAGDGTFLNEVVSELPVDGDPVAGARGMFDADALSDLVVADASAALLHVFQGLGDGLFSLRVSFGGASGGASPLAVAVADFDRNGRDDLAVAGGDHRLSVWLMDADGNARNAQTIFFQAGSMPVAIVPVDLNVDAAHDLVVTLSGPPGVSVVLNAGALQSGRFGPPSPVIDAGPAPASLAAGDFNRDGFPDLVVTNPTADTLTTFFGDGQGALVRSETYRVGLAPNAVAIGDFNGDGWNDVAVAHRNHDTLSLLRNRGGPAAP